MNLRAINFRRTIVVLATAGLFSCHAKLVFADGDSTYTDFLAALEMLDDEKMQWILAEQLSEYIRSYPEAENLDEMHFKMSTIYHDRGKTQEAFFLHMQFLYLYPNSRFAATVRDRVRAILVQNKKYEAIRQQVESAIDQNAGILSKEAANHAFLRDMLGLQFQPIRELLADACQAFLGRYRTSEYAPEVMFWRGELLAEADEPREALVEFLKLTYLHNTSLYVTSSKLKMADILTDELNQHQKAIITLEEFLLEYPKDPQAAHAQLQIAVIHEKRDKKYLEAVNAYTAVAEKYPKSMEAVPALFEAARLYEDRFKEYDQAIRVYNEVVRDFPDDLKAPHAMAEAARIYEKKQKDFLNAANVYYKVYANYPESSIAAQSLFAAGEISEKKLKEPDKAIEYYRLITEKYPGHKLADKANKRLAKLSKESISQ